MAITQRLLVDAGLVLDEDAGHLSSTGRGTLASIGIDVPEATRPAGGGVAMSCRPCLDWSERRLHIAGKLASHICHHCLERGWLLRRPGSRALDITPKGRAALQPWLGMQIWSDAAL